MIGASAIFSMSEVNKRRFIESVKSDPQTHSDWTYGQWNIETSGKEDDLFSPFLKKRFDLARKAGLIPDDLNTITGTWGEIYDSGALTHLNSVHLLGYDGTDPGDLGRGEMEHRKQAMHAIAALKA